MNKNNHPDALITRTEQLRDIVGDLTEVHSLLELLCTRLAGGGIVEARQLESMVAEATPKLRKVVHAVSTLTYQGGSRVEGRRNRSLRSKNPLLM